MALQGWPLGGAGPTHGPRHDPGTVHRVLTWVTGLLGPGPAHAAGSGPGDLDGDCDVDRDDVRIVLSHRRQPATRCPECDIDGDGTITVLDARRVVLLCTQPRCAIVAGSSCGEPGNRAPSITSTPVTGATEGQAYTYDVDASDPDPGDTLTFSLITAPGGMTIHPATGVIGWVPDATQGGDHTVVVEVTDAGGLTDAQTFTVTVALVNDPPVAVDDFYEVRTGETLAVPPDGVLGNDSDPDGDPLTAVGATGPSLGALDLRADGSFDYTPFPPSPGTLGFSLKYAYGPQEAQQDSPIVTGHPVVTDADGDGTSDILFMTGWGTLAKLVALRGDTGAVMFKRGTGGPEFSGSARIAAGDIDLDGRPEIVVVGGETGRSSSLYGLELVAYEETGDIKWVSEPLPSRYFHSGDPKHATMDGSFRDAAVVIADIDTDGTPEIVVGHGVASTIGVTVYDNSGKKRWTRIGTRKKGPGISPPGASPAVADIDLDGRPEIVYLNTVYGNRGEVRWVADMRAHGQTGASIANLDDDPYAEIVLWERGSRVTVLEHDGTRKWSTWLQGNGNYPSPITVADVDRDGYPEILAAKERALTVLRRDGTVLWQNSLKHSRFSAATVFDFERDGYPEVVFRDDDGVVKVWDGRTGALKLEFDTGLERGHWYTCPIMADVDGDGRAEMVLVGSDMTFVGGLYVYESPNDDWAPVRSVWNQWPYGVTNVNPDGTIPAYAEPHWLVPGLNTFRVNERLPDERVNRSDGFTYRASDGELESDEATVHLTVLPPNDPPRILSLEGGVATAGFGYLYRIVATDPDPGETLLFSLVSAPDGMTIDETTGLVRWTPDGTQTGSHQVRVEVTDSQGVSISREIAVRVIDPIPVPGLIGLTQADAEAALAAADLTLGTVSTAPSPTAPAGRVIAQDPPAGTPAPLGLRVGITVSTGPDTTAPLVNVVASPPRFDAGGATLITVYASDDGTVTGRTLSVDGTDLALNASGQATFTPAAPGVYTATGTATDDAGNTGRDTIEILVGEAGDTTPPEVSFTTPADGDIVTGLAEIKGTATDPNFHYYDLALSRDGTTWTPLARGTSPVVDGVLGTLDPSNLIDNPYQLRLRAWDLSGNRAEAVIGIGIASGGLKIGQFTVSFTDLTVPVSGVPITIVRTYDSRDKAGHDFGVGWRLAVRTTDVVEDDDMNVFITLPDGRRTAFAFTPEYLGILSPNIPLYRPAYTATSGSVTYTLTCEECPDIEVTDYWGPWIDPITMKDFNPTRYLLTALDGTRYTIDQYEGLEEIRDPNENTLTFSDAGIVHSSGKKIEFVRDGEGRITRIIDPMGNAIAYEYDTNGDLVAVTDREGNTSRYAYDAGHYLLDMITPDGVRVARNEYDESGRLVATQDAHGNRMEFDHDIDARREVVTDRRGHVTVYEYDERGNVLQRTDPLGKTWTYTYDDNGNRLSETDPLGNTTTYTYDDRNNLLTRTDPLGNTWTYTYSDLGQVVTVTDPLGNITTHAYDASGNLLSTTDPEGNVTRFGYDAGGNLISVEDCQGNTTTYAYDAWGNRIRETDPLGNETDYTYDANGNRLTRTTRRTTDAGQATMVTEVEYDASGRPITITDPAGNDISMAYDSAGRLIRREDKNGNVTTYGYDSAGNLTRVDYPDGTFETYAYDANGNRTQFTDRGGNTTRYEYDALNRLVRTVFPDGTERSVEYDAAGRVVATVDENGGRTVFVYDKAGRNTGIRDAAGSTTLFGYDASGNLVSATDARGHVTRYEYDANGRRVRTVFPDGTSTGVEYAGGCASRVASRTDQAGNTTRFAYDALGRLTKVTDPLGNETSYDYDEVGNRIRSTDANGHKNAWEYDDLGRVVRHRLPLGMEETFTYDANGNIVARTDYTGSTTRFSYDAMNRLTARYHPDGTTETFAYTPTGKRETVTDRRGHVTVYEYDVRGRLTRVTGPGGRAIAYAYDDAGNITSVETPSGTTAYGYEAGRLRTVKDPAGGMTIFTHDDVGNRTRIDYPNGVSTTVEYDSLNRLTRQETTDRLGTVVAGTAYRYDATGRLAGREELDGTKVSYAYDGAGRLVEEKVVDPSDSTQTTTYAYDRVGNRITRQDAGGTLTYTYDENDRLLKAGATTYKYDANGNLVGRTDGSGTTGYTYDPSDRLVAVTGPAGTGEYAYDADGIMVHTTANGVSTSYLVDGNRAFAQVLEERDTDGDLVARYVVGDFLIRQDRGGQTRFFIPDRLGSTRYLTDGAGAIASSYSYDAFGSLVARTGPAETPYLFAGERRDPLTGFYYLRARHYDPASGRFSSVDPEPGDVFAPQTLHPYVYAGNDPVNLVDRSGRSYTLTDVVVSLTVEANLMKAYISMAGRAFLGSAKIASCVIDPGAKIQEQGMKWLSDPYLGNFAALMVQTGHDMVAEGLKQVSANLQKVMEDFAKSLLSPKFTVRLGIMVRMSQQTAMLLKTGQQAKEVYDKAKSASDTLMKMKSLWEGLSSGNLCEQLEAIEKLLSEDKKDKKQP